MRQISILDQVEYLNVITQNNLKYIFLFFNEPLLYYILVPIIYLYPTSVKNILFVALELSVIYYVETSGMYNLLNQCVKT